MVRFIKYRAKTTAAKRSKEIWEQMLGSPVSTTSTTKYFYDFVASSKSFGGSYLLIHDDGALLNEDEKTNLDEEEWSQEDFDAWLLKYGPVDSQN